MRIGTGELLVVLAIALIVFGPAKLPELGKVLGETVGNLKKQMNSVTDELDLTDAKPAKKTVKSVKPVLEEVEPKVEADGKEVENG